MNHTNKQNTQNNDNRSSNQSKNDSKNDSRTSFAAALMKIINTKINGTSKRADCVKQRKN